MVRSQRTLWLVILISVGPFLLMFIAGFASAADFALRDGDTVVFLGDSITAAQTYGKVIENYTLLRFPDRKVRFINAGRGGDTAAGGLARLETDVFDRGATVLTVAYGFNDIGWGIKADAEHRQKYIDSIQEIVRRCREKNVRVFICSAAITAEDPDKAEQGFFQAMCDDGLSAAKELGGGTIDVQRSMREIQRRIVAANLHLQQKEAPHTLHVADGVHLNDLGQLAMAFAILKGLGAPAEVSSAVIDAEKSSVLEATGCQLDQVAMQEGVLRFDRLDAGLPINFGLFGALQFRFVPIPDQLNRYLLTVKNLPDGKYEVLADGRKLSTYTSGQLAAGVNISSVTADAWEPGGPWDAQASALKHLTDARTELHLSQVQSHAFLPDDQHRAKLAADAAKINAGLEDLQRQAAGPRKYRFEVRPVK